MRISEIHPAGALQDLRYAARALRRGPGSAGVAILSLVLGMGASVAVYSVLDAVVLRPLPVMQPERLALVHLHKPPAKSTSFSYPLFRRIAAGQNVFESMLAAGVLEPCRVSAGERAIGKPTCRLVTRNYFDALGVRAARGRFFDEADTAPAVVVSHRFWTRDLDGRQDAIGSLVRINGVPFPVAAVAPPEFLGESTGLAPDVFVPVDLLPQTIPGVNWLTNERSYWLWVIGRLKDGVSMKEAEAALERLKPNPKMRIRVDPGSQGLDHLRKQYGNHVKLLAAAAVLLLLVGCANSANLLLARAATRRKEIAIRQAVGASRARITRQLLTESLLLSLFSGGVGMFLGVAGGQFLAGLVTIGGQPIHLRIGADLRVLGFTAAVCLFTTLSVGLAPALRASRIDLARSIQSGWRAQKGEHQMSGRALVACQCALSTVLITGTALLAMSLWNLRNVDPGFVAEDVTTGELSVVPTRAGIERLVRLPGPLEERLRAMPGVRAAAVSTFPVLSRGWQSSTLLVPGRPSGDGELVHVNQVTAGFFETYRIGLIRGRLLAGSDGPTSPRVAVINERLARQYFGRGDPLGRQVGLDSPKDSWTIVGLVRDAKYHDLRDEAPPQIYLPIGQANAPGIVIGVRSEPGTTVTSRQIRAALAEVDGGAAIREQETLVAHVEATLERERLMATLGLAFGGMALALAVSGVYATMAYSVARRTKEVALRIALGAAPRRVQGMVLREAVTPALAGIAGGVPLALGAARALRSVLYGIAPASPAPLFAATAIIVAASVLAAWLPARCAARVDPMKALTSE